MMKTYLNLFFLVLITCASCGNRKTSARQDISVAQDTLTKFVLPQIPPMLDTPELRADYLIRHYWDNVNFADTNYIHHPDITEQAWVDYIHILRVAPATLATTSLNSLFQRAKVNKKVFHYFADLAEKYLYDPNSPMRNEELYIPVLDAMLEGNLLDETEKILPQGRRTLAEKNRPGRVAADFRYTLASGKSGSLHDVKAEYTLLFFNNPGCHACKEGIEELKHAPTINAEKQAGRLKILAIYPDEEKEEWDKHLPDFPQEWINGYDKQLVIIKNNLYDLKAIPTLYLLDKDKKVLLKDATVAQIDQYLMRQ